jgi:pyruvate dehydrogenase E1 component
VGALRVCVVARGGATAPVWGALARRYVDSRFGPTGTGRQYSLIGDAELDEGACGEAIIDPLVSGLGEVVWIVDLNRQSLDRVVPSSARTGSPGCSRRRAGRC